MAGEGQFGTPAQGIFAWWVNAHLRGRPLTYIGFDGEGKQVRDALHPTDLAVLLSKQMRAAREGGRRIYTAGGGTDSAMSLCQLNAWCDARFSPRTPASDLRPRPFDIPWVIMDNSETAADFDWRPAKTLDDILTRIAAHAEQHPNWLETSGL